MSLGINPVAGSPVAAPQTQLAHLVAGQESNSLRDLQIGKPDLARIFPMPRRPREDFQEVPNSQNQIIQMMISMMQMVFSMMEKLLSFIGSPRTPSIDNLGPNFKVPFGGSGGITNPQMPGGIGDLINKSPNSPFQTLTYKFDAEKSESQEKGSGITGKLTDWLNKGLSKGTDWLQDKIPGVANWLSDSWVGKLLS